MPADKLRQFVEGPEFLRRANVAVEKAVHNLEAKGIKPIYIERDAARPAHSDRKDERREKSDPQ